MTLSVEFWTLVSLSITFLGAVIGIVWGLIRNIVQQSMHHIETHFTTIEKNQKDYREDFGRRLASMEQYHNDEDKQWSRIERAFLEFKADLPINYVRREDYVRGQSTLEAKIDALAIKIENVQLRAMLNKEVS
jgi:hypothetical protein